jgi:DNA-binding XRE family transcriptional regulator
MKDDRIKAERTRRLNLILAGKPEPQKYNEWLRNTRLEMELSQPEMAEYIGISPTDYRYLEWGAACRPALTSRGEWSTPAKKIAAFFDVKPHEIFGDGPNGVEPHEALLLHGDFSHKAAIEASEAYEQKEVLRLVGEMLETLSEREEKIIRMRFGFDGKPMTLDAVGRVFGISRERVRQIEIQCLREIRCNRKFSKLREFHWDYNVALRPCEECQRSSSTVFRCKACDRQVCHNCWPYDRGLCSDCSKLIWSTEKIREYEDRCEAQFQRVKKKEPHVKIREARERRIAKRRARERRRLSRLKFEEEQSKIQNHIEENKGYLPQCVEDILDGYFKRLKDRREFESMVARGRYYYQAKLNEIKDDE